MSKAILVMDMPSCCNQCSLCEYQDSEYFCIPDDFSHYLNIKATERPDWCPLKKLPQKPDYPPINESSYVAGYNACIDEILKGGGKDE